MENKAHNETIISQFTMQAAGYTAIASHSNALDKLIAITSPTKEDTVLDVACGSGIVSLAFAKKAKHVTGVDITEEMLSQAKKAQHQFGLNNTDWILAEADDLPFATNHFSMVITRFSFHHFIKPHKVWSEMLRVCKPGGTIMVVDVAVEPSKSKKYDEMEKLRDSSHAKVLSPKELEELFVNGGLKNIKADEYIMEIELEEQLRASFSEDKAKLKQMIIDDVTLNNLGVNVTKEAETFHLFYPIHILVGSK